MWGADPDSVDPALATGNIGSWTLLNATCAKLFNTLPDPATGRTVGRASLPRSLGDADRLATADVHVRAEEDVPLPQPHAGDRAELRRRIQPQRQTELNSLVRRRGWLQEIVGANAAMRGSATTISGVQVLGRYRLRVHLRRRAGDFIPRLSMPSFCPILPGTTAPAGIGRPPGSGPYYIADRVPNRRILLERNPYYGVAAPPTSDRIVWTIEPNAAERVRATERDENDFVGVFAVQNDVVRDLENRYGLNRPEVSSSASQPSRTSSSCSTLIGPRSRAWARRRSGRQSTTRSTGRP